MSKWRNIKIYVPSEKISRMVQKELFDDGCKWCFGPYFRELDKPYLYVSNKGTITCSSDVVFSDKHYFPSHPNKEVHYLKIIGDDVEILEEDSGEMKDIIEFTPEQLAIIYTVFGKLNGPSCTGIWRSKSDIYYKISNYLKLPDEYVQSSGFDISNLNDDRDNFINVVEEVLDNSCFKTKENVKEVTIAELEVLYGMKVKVVGDKDED